MRSFTALLRRELGVYFVSPTAYVILTALLFISGAVFANQVEIAARGRFPFDYSSTLAWISWITVISSAFITMRLVAEEKSRGTLEIVLTAPVSEAQFVLAKFAGAMVLLAYLVLPTVAYVLIVSMYGQVDAGAVACGYLGVLLAGAFMFSIGLFVSSLSSSQVTAAMVTLVIGLGFLLLMIAGGDAGPDSWVRRAIETVDLQANLSDFLRGVVDTSRLVWLLSVPAFFLFLTTRVLESRRWR